MRRWTCTEFLVVVLLVFFKAVATMMSAYAARMSHRLCSFFRILMSMNPMPPTSQLR